jgi:hypothetical protein
MKVSQRKLRKVKRQRWEYRAAIGEQANALGLEGWELVHIVRSEYGVCTFHFKRRVE